MSAAPASPDTFKCKKTLKVGSKTYEYFSLPDAEKNGLAGISKLPFSLKVLIENLLRFEDGRSVKADDIRAVVEWLKDKTSTREIAYRPARVLMQDFTGVPAVVDLAAMRDAMKSAGRRSLQDQPAGAGRPRHRPLRAGRLLRHRRRLQEERRDRVRAQQGALRVPALGRGRLQQLPRGAAGHRHLPSGQPRVPGAVGVDQAGGGQDRAGLPRYLRRHRQPHHHGQRAGRARLGRRRHRGGGRHARPAGRHGDPRGDRLRLQGQAAGKA